MTMIEGFILGFTMILYAYSYFRISETKPPLQSALLAWAIAWAGGLALIGVALT